MAASSTTIGLDIGTTNFSVAIIQNHRVEIIANDDGNRVTPCVVSFSDNQNLIGDVALSQASQNIENTILDVRKFLGRSYDDPSIQDMISNSKVKIVEDDGILKFDVNIGGVKSEQFTAVQIMGKLFHTMKQIAVNYVGHDVTNAVVSVPSYFNDSQRKATVEAAALAYINVTVIDEPIAACQAFKSDKKFNPNSNILVFNMGGSTVDATLLRYDGKQFIVKCESHDEDLGGNNIDTELRKFLIQKFNQKHGMTLTDSQTTFWKLNDVVKRIKHNFSTSMKENVAIENLSEGNNLMLSMTKVRFEGLCFDLFSSAFEHVEKVLKISKLNENDIDEIILTGGSSKISKLQEMFTELFPKFQLKKAYNFDEVNVRGSTIYGHSLVPANLEEVVGETTLHEVPDQSEMSGDATGTKKKIKKTNRFEEEVRDVAIGIDLGTTNSCVAVVRNGKVEIIANAMGHRITPSFVAFTDSERLIGDAAKAQASWNSENTIFDAKRLIGRKFNDVEINKKIPLWPFQIINANGNPQFQVTYKNQTKVQTPEEISSAVLIEMKLTAEAYLGHEVKKAVITVPAYFNDSQRQATVDAGEIAGLEVLKLINEPTAAAIAYGVDRKIRDKRNVLIYDLGGGTFDVVVLTIQNGHFEVQAVSGNTYLGGGDFDNRLVEHFVNDFIKKQGVDLRQYPNALSKLRIECEKVKRNLSTSISEKVRIEKIIPNMDISSSISRTRFEDLCSDLFDGTLEPVEEVLTASGLDKSEIDEVVLAGGSTRIPKIQELLQEFFENKPLNKSINPDEAVAYGAALHAAVITGDKSVDEIILSDVTPLSLGLDVEQECFTFKLIHKNTHVPATEIRYFTTMFDNQPNVYINIYEGEKHSSRDNNHLGEFTLDGIQKAPKEVPCIEVTYSINENAILQVTARDCSTEVNKSISVITNKGRLMKEDICRMIQEAKDYEAASSNENNLDKVRIDLEILCIKMKGDIRGVRRRLPETDFDIVDDACTETIQWIEDNPKATMNDFHDKKKYLDNLYGKKVI